MECMELNVAEVEKGLKAPQHTAVLGSWVAAWQGEKFPLLPDLKCLRGVGTE